MCGICGFIDYKGAYRASSHNILNDMVRFLHHRGPDDHGVYHDEGVGLAQARLSIIDLSANGHQPMSDASGRCTISFNGEIYNYRELRAELAGKGYTFNSDTDTEVILNLWLEYGVDCLDKMRGMFAFVIYDKKDRSIFMARDRLGQKPLFYVENDDLFIFGSEPKAILAHPGYTAKPDIKAIHNYLAYQSVPAPLSAFAGMKQLPPAHYIRIDSSGNLDLRRYWKLSYANKFSKMPEKNLQQMIIDKLRESIRMRLRSDVPLGAFLSGGIDSSLVVALMAEELSDPVKTFSIGFNEKEFDETSFARMVSERYSTEHHELTVTPDAKSIFSDLVWHYNQPFADPSAIPTYFVSKLARENVTVALSGDAGDENFGGYSRYLFPQGIPARSNASGLLDENSRPCFAHGKSARNRLQRLTPARLNYYQRFAQWHEEHTEKLLTREFRSASGEISPVDLYLNLAEDCGSSDFLDSCMYFDFNQYLPDTLMSKVDIASMAFSLEVRSPMLDHKFVEMAAQIPSEYKIKNGSISKYILKKAAEKYLPKEVIYRPKMGFGVPLDHWFRDELKEFSFDTLLSRRAIERGYFDPMYVEEILNRHLSGENWQYLLWNLLMLEQWHNMFIDRTLSVPENYSSFAAKSNTPDPDALSLLNESGRNDISNRWENRYRYESLESELDSIAKELMVLNVFPVDLSAITKFSEGIFIADLTFFLGEQQKNTRKLNSASIMLYENGLPLKKLECDPSELCCGGFVVKNNEVYFKSTDQTDPRFNEYCYSYTTSNIQCLVAEGI